MIEMKGLDHNALTWNPKLEIIYSALKCSKNWIYSTTKHELLLKHILRVLC